MMLSRKNKRAHIYKYIVMKKWIQSVEIYLRRAGQTLRNMRERGGATKEDVPCALFWIEGAVIQSLLTTTTHKRAGRGKESRWNAARIVQCGVQGQS